MTLTHLFKAQAIFAWLWVVMIWVTPEMAIQGTGWELTPNLQSMFQFISVCFLILGVISWMLPTWASDNLKQVGMVVGVGLNALFLAITMYHVSTEAANFDPLGAIPIAIFLVLFFWKSRA